jgi:hypothetical protein
MPEHHEVENKRAKPGSSSHGNFYHIEVRPPRDFVQFRVQDVGAPGGVERVAGRRANGSWETQKWLIQKTHAHLEAGRLVPDTAEAKNLLASLGSAPRHVEGDRFSAEPRTDVPESGKPTAAMRRAQLRNVKQAQDALRVGRKGSSKRPRGSGSKKIAGNP